MEQYVESVKGETKSAASSLFLPLKMSYFLGDSSAKGHVEFDVWLYEVECLMKSESVSPDSMYNSLVPILIGTHILSPVLQVCRQSHGDTFLQVADLHTGYYLAFRSMILQQKELSIMKGRLCLIRCAESEKVVVGPNSSILLRGYMDKKLPFRDSCTVVQPSRKVSFSDLEIMPSIIQYRHRDNPFIDVRVHNTTTRTVLIPTRAVVCELQPVTIEQEAQENFSTDDRHSSLRLPFPLICLRSRNIREENCFWNIRIYSPRVRMTLDFVPMLNTESTLRMKLYSKSHIAGYILRCSKKLNNI